MDDPRAQKKPPPFEMKITCDPATGSVQLSAPMEDKAHCIKALTVAIQMVVDYNPALVARPNGHA